MSSVSQLAGAGRQSEVDLRLGHDAVVGPQPHLPARRQQARQCPHGGENRLARQRAGRLGPAGAGHPPEPGPQHQRSPLRFHGGQARLHHMAAPGDAERGKPLRRAGRETPIRVHGERSEFEWRIEGHRGLRVRTGNLPRNDETSINAAFLRGSLSTMSVVDTLRLVVAPPHPAGYRFIAAGLAVFFVGLPLGGWLAWPALLFTLFCLYFFRDPERVPPACAWARAGARRWPRRFGHPGAAAEGTRPGQRAALAGVDLPVGARCARQPHAGGRHGDPGRRTARVSSSAPRWTRRARTTSATPWRCGWRMGATWRWCRSPG